jgi:nucleotide-binding universal stress UspA family protein
MKRVHGIAISGPALPIDAKQRFALADCASICKDGLPKSNDPIERSCRRTRRRARAMAEDSHVKLDTHVLAGHPVRDIVELAKELRVELLVIGATGHSAIYDRLIGSRADRIVQLAHCPVLVVK